MTTYSRCRICKELINLDKERDEIIINDQDETFHLICYDNEEMEMKDE